MSLTRFHPQTLSESFGTASCIRSILFLATLLAMAVAGASSALGQPSKPSCAHTVKAEVAAFEQVFYYNRFGSFNPAGLMYALKRDLVPIDASRKLGPGNVRLREDKRPRPLVLRVNEEDCLEVTFWNYLSPQPPIQFPVMVPQHALAPPNRETRLVPYPSPDSDYPATRAASMHVNGLDYVPVKQDASPLQAKVGIARVGRGRLWDRTIPR